MPLNCELVLDLFNNGKCSDIDIDEADEDFCPQPGATEDDAHEKESPPSTDSKKSYSSLVRKEHEGDGPSKTNKQKKSRPLQYSCAGHKVEYSSLVLRWQWTGPVLYDYAGSKLSPPAQILSDAQSASRFQPVHFVTDCAPRLGKSEENDDDNIPLSMLAGWQKKPFNGKPLPEDACRDPGDIKTPYEYFERYFTDELMEQMALTTNQYYMANTGITSAGIGFSQFEEITACMDVPIFTKTTYAKVQNKVYEKWESASVESMAAATLQMAPKKDYTPQQMGWAIEAVKKGLKISEAAKKFNVPRITLHNKVNGKSPIECSMGPSTILSKEEENILEIWIKEMLDKHIPVTKEDLMDSVQRIIIDKKQETPFEDNRPGKK
ncbi:unnamed protein product [Parnassius apollo]|uniref:(apollo) hypothetical protein n=1 Tax=Parnassius apollo TaxID=110799 RepID=A0A8S3XGP2_PARAO|nr:unnamed protein product [Parnassius apollo]